MTNPTNPAAELATGLERVLATVRDDPGVRVEELTRLSGGASRETWSLTVTSADRAPETLVLQRTVSTPGKEVAPGREAALLRGAAAHGVPVPEVIAASSDGVGDLGGRSAEGAGVDSWVLARAIPGETLGRRVVRDDTYAEARQRLVGQCGAALAGIHRMEPVPGLEPMEPLERYEGVLDLVGLPHPIFELALRWLRTHPAPPRPQTVVHGDFRLGNLIVGPDGLRAVLDWEIAHLGNPVEDLGWLCVRAWRFGGPRPVAGVGEREELLRAYEGAGGDPVSLEELRWWEVLGTLAWGVMCIMQAERHRSGGERSVELAAIGRRVCENEWDLCRLLQPELAAAVHAAPTPEAQPFPAGPHDVPTGPELLDAVRAYLDETARPLLEGRPAFHARVASNVLATVQREWELGAGLAAAHAERLGRLGFADDGALAAAIRSGAGVAGREEELWRALTEAAHDKLRVANPAYAERP